MSWNWNLYDKCILSKCLPLIFPHINSNIDSYSKWIRQKCYQFFIDKKLKKTFYFLTCISPNYVPHQITKEFWKNSQFENVTAGFLLRSQNSLRLEICLIWHWNIHGSKSSLLDMLWSQKKIKKSSRYNTNYI